MSIDTEQIMTSLGICVVAAPALLFAYLGVSALVGVALAERTIARATQTAVVVGLLSSVAILALMLAIGTRSVVVERGDWVLLQGPHAHFHFTLKFVFDRLSVPFVIMSYMLCGTIGAFANSYMHREAGFSRFFVFFAMFLTGMITTSLAGTIETLFAGWELVGLASALLVAFFQERPSPVRNGLRVWSVYRVADAAFLAAAVALHHLTGEGDFSALMGRDPWPDGLATLSANQVLFVGSLLLIAAAGKSALVPFSGWLPRAMEGPTPSSAVFYGALSIHLGAFLLLRVSPILALSPVLSFAVVAVGLTTAIFASVAGRVQPDIKGALAFASLTQIGIIVIEIGLGWHYIALAHIVGHAFLRTLQLLRAPTLLHDYHTLENAIGDHLHHAPSIWERLFPPSARDWVYRMALHRGYLDSLIGVYIVGPFVSLFRWCDSMERRWTDALAGGRSTIADQTPRSHDLLEEVP